MNDKTITHDEKGSFFVYRQMKRFQEAPKAVSLAQFPQG